MRLQAAVFQIVLAALLTACVTPRETHADELCAPFRDGVVDPERIQAMLSAAEHGHLYRIVPSTSRVGFCVDSEFSRVNAEFRNFHGGLSLWPDPGDEEQVMVLINVDSLDTGSAIVENILKSEHFFDVVKYPQILFTSTDIHWINPTTAILKGDLTLHGVTRPVDFQVSLTSLKKDPDGHVERLLAKAGTTISRKQFGMGQIPQLIEDNVDLCMSVEAIRSDK
jgi:polyisoprenoid-binding protein YceI